MKVELKDVLHLYLGCHVMDYVNDKTGTMISIHKLPEVGVLHRTVWHLKIDEIKPILRPLPTATYEEISKLGQILDPDLEFQDDYNGYTYSHWNVGKNFIEYVIANSRDEFYFYPNRFIKAVNECRRMQFDMDNLIAYDLAIDATKQTAQHQKLL